MSAALQFDLLGTLLRKKLLLVLFAVVGAGAGIAYSLLATPWYSASLAVIPSQRSSNPAGLLMGELPGIEALGVSSSTDVQKIQAVLNSTSVADAVIEKFELKKLYETDVQEFARKELKDHCVTVVDRKSGVVTLTCEDRDPKRAQEMAAYFGEVGNAVFGRISASSAREERRFLEQQVAKARADVDDASNKLRVFQETNRVVDLGEQSKAVISAMASIEGDLVSKQLELSYLKEFSSSSSGSVTQLRQQIAILESKLVELEMATTAIRPPTAGSGSAGPDAKFFPEAMRVPELRFQLEQLFREQKIKETVFFLLTQRHETARVDEARDTSTFQILDQPTLPQFRSRPRRKKVVLLSTAVALIAGCVVAFAPAFLKARTQKA
jgi:capsule polysaccharide export protein KpsE/RkpR